jgi:hypothetical protein
MNITDTQKYLVSGKLKVQRENEHIANVDAARNLGIPANYVSMICNPAQWEKCPAWAWNKANTWYNSGQKLSEYSVARSAVSSSRNDELKPEVKEKLIAETKHAMKKTAKEVQKEAQRKDDEKPITPLAVEKTIPAPDVQFTDTARLKVALDIEINLVVNGQKVLLQ